MILIWTGFTVFIVVLLALDLGVLHRHAHKVTMREALWMSALWIAIGLGFTVFVYYGYENHWLGLGNTLDSVDRTINDGKSAALKYLTGYVVEKSLSVDNIFVMAVLFGYFAVPDIYQHRVLYWGIIGALAMRAVMIVVGTALIAQFHWVLYLFGGFLVITGLRMFFIETGPTDPDRNVVVRMARKLFPVTARYHGEHFFVRAGAGASLEDAYPGAPRVSDPAVDRAKPGTLMITPLALALIMVETTDLVFAVDSIPAIFAVTADPFLVFTSNVFAVLGLRSLYFALAGMITKFRFLKPALAMVLLLVGVKMLIADWLRALLGEHFNFYLLGAVLLIISAGVVMSLLVPADADDAAHG